MLTAAAGVNLAPEHVEDARQRVGGDAGAVVAHADRGHVTLVADGQRDRAVWGNTRDSSFARDRDERFTRELRRPVNDLVANLG